MKKKTGGLGKGISGKGMSALIPEVEKMPEALENDRILNIKKALLRKM